MVISSMLCKQNNNLQYSDWFIYPLFSLYYQVSYWTKRYNATKEMVIFARHQERYCSINHSNSIIYINNFQIMFFKSFIKITFFVSTFAPALSYHRTKPLSLVVGLNSILINHDRFAHNVRLHWFTWLHMLPFLYRIMQLN